MDDVIAPIGADLNKVKYSESEKSSVPLEVLDTILEDGDSNGEDGNGGQVLTISEEHFEIIWSNLSYKIEPKWYKKINFIDRLFNHLMPGQTMDNHSSATSTASSSAGMNDNQHQMHTSANADRQLQQQLNLQQRLPLEHIQIFKNLNGTIKSGQMTAVLGPSGKSFCFSFSLANLETRFCILKTLINSHNRVVRQQ